MREMAFPVRSVPLFLLVVFVLLGERRVAACDSLPRAAVGTLLLVLLPRTATAAAVLPAPPPLSVDFPRGGDTVYAAGQRLNISIKVVPVPAEDESAAVARSSVGDSVGDSVGNEGGDGLERRVCVRFESEGAVGCQPVVTKTRYVAFEIAFPEETGHYKMDFFSEVSTSGSGGGDQVERRSDVVSVAFTVTARPVLAPPSVSAGQQSPLGGGILVRRGCSWICRRLQVPVVVVAVEGSGGQGEGVSSDGGRGGNTDGGDSGGGSAPDPGVFWGHCDLSRGMVQWLWGTTAQGGSGYGDDGDRDGAVGTLCGGARTATSSLESTKLGSTESSGSSSATTSRIIDWRRRAGGAGGADAVSAAVGINWNVGSGHGWAMMGSNLCRVLNSYPSPVVGGGHQGSSSPTTPPLTLTPVLLLPPEMPEGLSLRTHSVVEAAARVGAPYRDEVAGSVGWEQSSEEMLVPFPVLHALGNGLNKVGRSKGNELSSWQPPSSIVYNRYCSICVVAIVAVVAVAVCGKKEYMC